MKCSLCTKPTVESLSEESKKHNFTLNCFICYCIIIYVYFIVILSSFNDGALGRLFWECDVKQCIRCVFDIPSYVNCNAFKLKISQSRLPGVVIDFVYLRLTNKVVRPQARGKLMQRYRIFSRSIKVYVILVVWGFVKMKRFDFVELRLMLAPTESGNSVFFCLWREPICFWFYFLVLILVFFFFCFPWWPIFYVIFL